MRGRIQLIKLEIPELIAMKFAVHDNDIRAAETRSKLGDLPLEQCVKDSVSELYSYWWTPVTGVIALRSKFVSFQAVFPQMRSDCTAE